MEEGGECLARRRARESHQEWTQETNRGKGEETRQQLTDLKKAAGHKQREWKEEAKLRHFDLSVGQQQRTSDSRLANAMHTAASGEAVKQMIDGCKSGYADANCKGVQQRNEAAQTDRIARSSGIAHARGSFRAHCDRLGAHTRHTLGVWSKERAGNETEYALTMPHTYLTATPLEVQ